MNGDFALYSRVRLITDRYAAKGVPEGSFAYIVESYGDGAYELDVYPQDLAPASVQFAVRDHEIEPAPEPGR